MTTNNVHALARRRPVSRLLLADSNPTEGAIAIRAIKRLHDGLQICSIATLADAAEILARERVETVLAGSGLDGATLPETIRWFAQHASSAVIVALLEQPDHWHRQAAREAGATFVCSKPDLIVAQLRHEFGFRLSASAPENARMIC